MESANTCLALDIGATNIKYAVVSSDGRISDLMMAPTRKDLGPYGLVDQIVQLYAEVKAHPQLGKNLGQALGLCAAGPLDPVEGRLLEPANLTDGSEAWKNFPLVEEIKKRLSCDVVLENDAAAAAWAEFWVGEGRDVDDLMTLAFGTGLGVGVIKDGRVLRTPDKLHPELGHSIVAFNAKPGTGAKVDGSLESVIGPKFFLQNVSSLKGQAISGKDFMELLNAEDPMALKQTEIFCDVLMAGLFNFYLAFAPKMFIFQGGFSPLLEVLQERIQDELGMRVKGFSRVGERPPQIAISKISRTCGVYGAAYGVLKTIS